MNPLRALLYRIRPLFGLRKLETEIAEEIQTHLDLAAEAHIARGLSPEEARRRAERDHDWSGTAAARYRDARGVSLLSGWWHDLRYTVRSLTRAKLFTLAAVITLALGIGSAAAIFSLVDWVLFRSVAYPQDVVVIGGYTRHGNYVAGRMAVYIQAYREQAESLAEYAFAHPYDVNVAINGDAVLHGVTIVSPNLFPLLGITPVLGRNFVPEEAFSRQGCPVIITYRFWREYLGGAPDVLGRKLEINANISGVVVGVLAPEQVLPPNLQTEVFVPLILPRFFEFKGWDWYSVFARVKPGVTLTQVDADLGRIKVFLPESVAAYQDPVLLVPRAATLSQFSASQNTRMYWVLVGAVGFLYAIACLNATNLMLARLIGRRRELSIRLALGGGHWRIVRLLAVESAVVTVAGSAIGILVANWLAPILRLALEPNATFHWATWSLDARALATLIGITLATAVIITAVPAVRILRNDLLEGLKDGGVTVGDAPTLARFRRITVGLQAAFAVVLLTGAGLMVQTLTRLQRVRLGFDDTHLMKVELAQPGAFDDARKAKVTQRLEQLRSRLEKVPGVASVAYGGDILGSGNYDDFVKVVTGTGPPVAAEVDFMSENFLRTSGLRLIRGSMGIWGQGVLLNETMARQMFGNKDPIGQALRQVGGSEGKYLWYVFGVVNDVHESPRSRPRNHIYASTLWTIPNNPVLIVRVTRPADDVMGGELRRAIYQFDPLLVVSYAVPLNEAIGWQSNVEKFVLATLQVLSGIALALTILGLFSLLAYTVDQRMTEFGVRQVLGATPRHLVALVVRGGLAIVIPGVGAGVLGAIALSRSLRSLLFETPPYDPLVLGTVALVLIVSGLLACLFPAARAAKSDVVRLLRSE